ncbi:MAG: sensor histidine kinase [Brumimicrobium sp.]|nr:sensor histidine kinase [Brumimicrobium sp.]
MNKILNIGIDDKDRTEDHNPFKYKIQKLFNGITFFGFLVSIPQILIIYPQDKLAALFHASWAVYCLIALFIHHLGYFRFAKFSVVLVVMIFGTLASARIGREFYPHIPSFGVMASVFIFFNLRKEWGFIAFFILFHAACMVFMELDLISNPNIHYDNPELIRSTMIIGTGIFIAIVIITVMRIAWLSEKQVNQNLKQLNDKLTQRNEEKTVLLQEVHHRVKNNLQIIISLIKLQTKSVDHDGTKAIFDELSMRLIAISRMHEMMYLSDSVTKINFNNYVNELSRMILNSLSVKENVELKVSSNVEQINVQSIIPIALILNELITNTLKYAFEDFKEDGRRIEIAFHQLEDETYELIYTDNGVWKTREHGISGFGLELIDILTEQLEGKTKRIVDESGTTFRFKISI